MKNTFRVALAALLALLLLLGSASAVMVDEDGYLEEILLEDGEQIEFNDSQADESLQASIDKVNEMQHILLLGIDARPGQTTGRTDTMIILTVDTNNQKIKLMSLMRDIIVAIPGRASMPRSRMCCSSFTLSMEACKEASACESSNCISSPSSRRISSR